MQTFLFTNAFFEEELSAPFEGGPCDFLEKHPLYWQLQFLSFLYKEPHQTPLLSSPPPKELLLLLEEKGIDSSFCLYPDLPAHAQLNSWGPSKCLSLLASSKNSIYTVPEFSLVEKIQSKAFALNHFNSLEGSRLIASKEELRSWWLHFKGPKVLKTCFGSSGRGHFIGIDDDLSAALAFFDANTPPLIAQPWVERVLDFSTQWNIDLKGTPSYLGATLCQNSLRGSYEKSYVGPERLLFEGHYEFFLEHLETAYSVAKKLASLQFFGPFGLDAFLYKERNSSNLKLAAILEVNARRTMGYVALKLREKVGGEGIWSLSYSSRRKQEPGLLPSFKEGKRLPKQLFFEEEKKNLSSENLKANLVCI